MQQQVWLSDLLVEAGALSIQQAQEIRQLVKETALSERDLLLERTGVTEVQLAEVLAVRYDLPFVLLEEIVVPESVLKLVEPAILRRHCVMPFAQKASNGLLVAMSDPFNLDALDAVAAITGMRVEPYLSTVTDVMSALDRHYGRHEMLSAAEAYTRERQRAGSHAGSDPPEADASDSPIILLVNSFIEQAARQRASDIHVEALSDSVRVRYRIDGVLYQRARYASQLAPALITRIKIISGMDISEKRKPQDGRTSYTVDRKEYDIRVSSLPTVFGETCVLRLQAKQSFLRDKELLGFCASDLCTFNRLLARPYGMVLITGPTGSGKTTTLYTALAELNREGVNIVTVEDPVEAYLDGVNQVQVNAKADLTFSGALRSILRQDPDIMMIGEIRDAETARIAARASITGHLVVSTLHTNSAVGAITRLADMGVDRYLIADAVIGIIAQRLVRRLCPHCKRPRSAALHERSFLGAEEIPNVTVYDPAGCARCGGTGFLGRIGVFELLEIDSQRKALISCGSPAWEIRQAAEQGGYRTLRQNASRLVLDGITSFSELLTISLEEP